MSLRLEFLPQVRTDVDEAYTWYEKKEPGLGEDFLARLESVFDRVRETPEAHQVILGDIRRAPVRRFSYGVYYRIQPNQILVVAVTHTRRDPSVWQSRGRN